MLRASRLDDIPVDQPALYLNNLRPARSIAGWASRLQNRALQHQREADDFRRDTCGYIEALREVAAHLRQGADAEGGSMIINQ